MKRMLSAINKVLKRQRGFTLVEMVTVVAIMGVMAAVAVPMVSGQLGKAREKSYLQDEALIQTAVDSFFTAADNVRYLGLRQYPLMGSSASDGNSEFPNSVRHDTAPVLFNASEVLTAPPVATLSNPHQGGNPKWRDSDTSDGNRELDSNGLPVFTNGEETLRGATAAQVTGGGPGWFITKVTSQGQEFAADTRDFFIDFSLLVKADLLQDAPSSASPDNGGGSTEGSYSWYVRENGQVESVLYFLPSNSETFAGVSDDPDTPGTNEGDGTIDTRGFQEGVYP